MSTITTEAAAGKGATVVPLVPADDIIETVTGLPLVDCDPKIIARRLRAKPWSDRARFFSNAIYDSIETAGKMLEYAKSKDDGADFLDWGVAEMMRRIGEALDLWGDAAPTDADSAALFLLSLNPRHRRAAKRWLSKQPGKKALPAEILAFVDGYMQQNRHILAVFYRMTIAGEPCEAAAWRAGPYDPDNEWFNFPDTPSSA